MSDDTQVKGSGSGENYDDALIGRVIDGCKIQRKLGQGGMGVVYLAIHESLEQEFVLKILNPALTGAEDTVERFFREAQACAQLNHPSIVAIQNVGQDNGVYYIRMEYVEGETLEDLIKEDNRVDWREATRLCQEVAEALAHAHQKGMIHRDIKPENVMRAPDGSVKVMDFGLAKHVHSSAKVSVTGQIVGTPFFMSPEQAGGKPTDARSDIYSLGVTLYYMVTGVKPFNGKNLQEIFLKHFFYAPESPKIYNDALPEALCEIIKICLKKKKKERYQSAKALARDLLAVLENPNATLGGTDDAGSSSPGDVDLDSDSSAGKTMVAGGDGEATVQVQGEGGRTVRVDDEGEATVQVAGEGGATVQVGDDDAATVQVKGSGGPNATVRVEDEEDAHAGLDLPTAMIPGFLEGPGPGSHEALVEAAAPARDLKKLVVGIAALILIPAILLGLLRLRASSSFGELEDRYGALIKRKDKEPKQLRALAAEMELFAESNPFFAGAMADLAARHKSTLESEADRIEREAIIRQEDEERAVAAKARAAKIESERKEILAKFRGAESEVLGVNDEALKAQKLGSREAADLWAAYVEGAKRLLSDYASLREDYPDIEERLAQLRYPVFVTSDPPGAEVLVEDQVRGRTPFHFLERPGTTVNVTLRRKGFLDVERTGVVSGLLYLDAALERKMLRGPLALGELGVAFGAGKVSEPIEPRTQLERSGEDRIVFVGHGGLLRAYSPADGRLVWQEEPHHEVATYGDPLADLTLIESRAILVASPLGQLRAHSPANGSVIWATPLDAPATSQPVFKRVFGLVTVGTASGTVYFIDDAGEVQASFKTENPVVTPPYFYGSQICVIGSTDNRLYAIDWRSGRVPKELSRLDLGADIVAGPLPFGRSLVVGTSHGQVHLIEITQRGELSLRATLGEAQEAAVSGILVDGDSLFFASGRTLASFDVDGKARWREVFTGAGDLTAPYATLEGGLIYVGDTEGTLYAVGKADGDTRWRFGIPSKTPITRAPLVVGEELFVPAGGKLYVLAAD